MKEIAITEDDLQEINKKLNKNLIEMEQSKLRWENKYFTLEQQLVEKDKEINKLQQMAIIDMQTKEILELQVTTIRKQICDELRDKLKKQIIPTAGTWLSYYDIKETNDLIDEIEQAKESMK